MITKGDKRRRREGRCRMCGFPLSDLDLASPRPNYCIDCKSEYSRPEYRDDYEPESEEEDAEDQVDR